MKGRAGGRYRAILLAAAIVTTTLQAAEESAPPQVVIRGKVQRVLYIPAQTRPSQTRPTVVFIPGDGGWRGAAVDMGRMVASLGCDVYGFDVRRYLTGFTTHGRALTEDQLASDMEQVVDEVGARSRQPVILVGWSQGAAMVVLAAARAKHKEAIAGVVTIALPEAGTLGWRLRDSLLSVFRRDAHEPEFQTPPLLPDVAPIPLWMIYGTHDRFTPAAAARRLASLARHPRRHHEIAGGNHNLHGHAQELMASLQAGLDWIERLEAVVPNRPASGAH